MLVAFKHTELVFFMFAKVHFVLEQRFHGNALNKLMLQCNVPKNESLQS